jgi:hypothetical protein
MRTRPLRRAQPAGAGFATASAYGASLSPASETCGLAAGGWEWRKKVGPRWKLPLAFPRAWRTAPPGSEPDPMRVYASSGPARIRSQLTEIKAVVSLSPSRQAARVERTFPLYGRTFPVSLAPEGVSRKKPAAPKRERFRRISCEDGRGLEARVSVAANRSLGPLHLRHELLLHQLASDRALRAAAEAGDLGRVGVVRIEGDAPAVARRQDAGDDL